jgi:diguanylate cyclase (GGDEF)-like protein
MAPLARVGRWTLLLKFTILSLVCFALLGYGLAAELAHQIESRAMSNAVRSAELLSDVIVRTQLQPSDLTRGMAPSRVRALDVSISQAHAQGRIARVKIWGRDGRILYADDHTEIGRRFPVEGDLRGAFAGRPFVDVSHGKDKEQRNERSLGPLLESYVPLRFAPGARPAGAFEIYLPYAPVAHATSQDVRHVYLLVAGGLAILYLLLYRIVARASRRLRHQAAESRQQALHDPLTGLPNRRALYERLERLLNRRAQGGSVSLLLADLDGFKELNDTLGHQAGDRVLSELGPRLTEALPDVELLARIGGDEFAVLIVSGPDRGAATGVAERLLETLTEPFAIDGISLTVRASVGIAHHPEHGLDANTLFRRADVAMYQAKATKSGWLEYEAERDEHSRARLALAGELRRAISDGELVVHYQPKADLAEGAVTSVEALVRWQHPERGLLSPAEFLPVAEHTGLIRPLTLYVLDDAVRRASEWEAAGLDLSVAVNLAMGNLLDVRLPEDVAALLAKRRLAPRRLILEITENVVMADPARIVHVLGRLRSLGVGLSLDDFGTGASSLAYLRELRVDELKIDRSFVTDMTSDEQNAAIVRWTIQLAHAMGLRVVAEGVEDADTLFELKAMGADAAQGFYLSRPVPPIEILAMLMHAFRDRRDEDSVPRGGSGALR